ncbi:hypothetical protein EDC04DRAFT_710976 [Pisolithus marmoratus]|nr:hypothetical protein EDC04DRAFT_710976 [Pisolithus marmoratus]
MLVVSLLSLSRVFVAVSRPKVIFGNGDLYSSRNRPGTVAEKSVKCFVICSVFCMGVGDIVSPSSRLSLRPIITETPISTSRKAAPGHTDLHHFLPLEPPHPTKDRHKRDRVDRSRKCHDQ